jgi:iron-sulfur cluster repair protein YtfE (RIC family)
MSIDTLDMLIVHRVFRREFHGLVALIDGVPEAGVARARIVGHHLSFMLSALHHHHAAEDDQVWPVLQSRAASSHADIERMVNEHAAIAATVRRVETLLAPWTRSADRQHGQLLVAAVAELSKLLDEHLDDEERVVVPIIERHLNDDEWQAMLDQGASYISGRNLYRGIVMGGMVLSTASDDERRAFLSNMRIPQRWMVQLFGPPAAAKYGRRLRGAP